MRDEAEAGRVASEKAEAEVATESPPGCGEGQGAAPPELDGDAATRLALKAEIEAVTESHRRLAADFANYRRRVERDRADWEDGARGELLLRLLPAFDNLRRARQAVDGTAEAGAAVGALTAGLDMVLRGLDETLAGVGLRESVSVGDPFDPAICEAIGEEPTAALAPGRVSSVLMAGYRLGERVLRPALVRVAQAPAGAEAAEGAGAAAEADGPAGEGR